MDPNDLTPDQQATVLATAELAGRTGAHNFEFGFLNDEPPHHWYAQAQYPGTRVITDRHDGPLEACQAFARRVLQGARCKCGGAVALPGDPGAYISEHATMLDGTEWTAEQATAAGTCQWEIRRERWAASCENPHNPPPPNAPPSTVQRLCQALINAGAPRGMVEKARAGGYDDFRSDSAFPIHELVAQARAVGLDDIANRAIAGEFDATPEESAAWAASPEGQETFNELVQSGIGSVLKTGQQHRPEHHKKQPKKRKRKR